MNSNHFLSTHLHSDKIPQCCGSHLITEDHSAKHAVLPHTHEDFLELYYVYSGEGRYMVNNHFYDVKEGDIVICNAGVLHGEDPSESRRSRSYSVAISNVCFLGLSENQLCDAETIPVISCGMLAPQVGELFHLIYLLSYDTKNLHETCNSLSLSLLLLTYEMILSRSRHAVIRPRSSSSATADRVQQYLDAHYREPITLAVVSKSLHINPYYLSHVFKNEFGVPPMQYVMKRRIGEAQSLLTDSTASIGDIADHLGFSSICHLNTMFNKYVGMPPGKYRQSRKNMQE